MADHVYHWKHGWIPLDHVAALSKAKGNHALATKMLSDAHSPDVGIRSRQDVAKAVLDLPNISKPADRHAPREAIKAAAAHHGAEDLLPGNLRSKSEDLRSRAEAKHAEAQRIAGATGVNDRAAAMLKPALATKMNQRMDSQLQKFVAAEKEAKALESQAHRAAAKEKEAARKRLTIQDVQGARIVRDEHGWHVVVKVNKKTVSVKTGYSWNDNIPIEKIHDARK